MPIDWNSFRTGGAFGGAFAQSLLPARELPGLSAGQRIGPYVVERELARGGMAIVYVARRADGEFEQRVALKWMAPSQDEPALEAMFRRERDILASLEHPGIARLLDGGRTAEGMLWFAMELVEGEAIDRWCEANGADRASRLRLVIALCEALAFAHGRLLIHRDIKPANVLVDARGRVRLLDFGIARLADQSDLQGHHALTPGFASPEQLRGEPTTVASDVYQVGLLLALLLGCVRAPAPGLHATQCDSERPRPDVTALPDTATSHLPAPLTSIIHRATAPLPGQRYASVDALRDDLERLLDDRPVRAHAGSLLYPLHCLVRRQPLASTAAVLALLAVIAGGTAANLSRIEARRSEARALQAQRTAEETTQFLLSIFRAPDPRSNPGLDLTARELLDRGIAGIDRLHDEPAVQASLLAAVGEVTRNLGDYTRAAGLLQRAIDMYAAGPAADPARLADLLTKLGNLQRETEALAEAAANHRRAIAVMAGAGLGGTAEAATMHNNLGLVLRRMGRLDEAQVELQQAIDMRAALGLPAMAEQLSNLGALQLSRGRFDLAHAGFESAWRALPAEMAENDTVRLTVLANLGLTSRELGRLGESLAYTTRVIRLERQTYGDGHPELASTLYGHGTTLFRLGRHAEARDALDRAVALRESALGATNPRSVSLRQMQLRMLLVDGPSETLHAAAAHLDGLATAMPADALALVRAGNERLLGVLALRERRLDDALARAQAAFDAAHAAGQPDSAASARVLAALAGWSLGRRDDAARWFAEAEATGHCGDALCALDSPLLLATRADWWLATGATDRARDALARSVDGPQWAHWMLDRVDTAVREADPRWAALAARLEDRLARDGNEPATTSTDGR
jgi:tetratricopeptide (TPR) repeat protein/tRNA A-37 threonylcarbamoyl transferase component Bud32